MKKYVLLLIIANITMPAMAQEETRAQFLRHEISIHGTLSWSFLSSYYGGISFNGQYSDKLSGGGGVGYTFFFHRHWGIATGAEMAFFYTAIDDREITESTPETYSYGGVTEPMYFNSTLKDFRETRQAAYLNIPLLLQFQTAGRHKFYVAAGAKAGLAVSGKYEATAANLTTSGYFPESDQTFTNMPNRGFTTLRKPSWTGAIDFGLNISASIETGVRWSMGKHVALYTGVYLDYGLLDVSPEKTEKDLVSYQAAAPSEFVYTHTLAACRSSSGAAYVKEVSLFSAGIKMRLAFGW
jgi:hypothetical protein